MPDCWKLDLLLGKMTAIESEINEIKMYLREITQLRKSVEKTDPDSIFQENIKLLEDVRRIAEGKRINR